MKKTPFLWLLAAMMMLGTLTLSARKTAVPKMYVFGFAASFNDTIVHFTDIQELDSAWIETKNGFLLERDAYSYQLRDHLDKQLQLPQRTCIVFYNLKRSKLEKQRAKMQRLYGPRKDGSARFDVRQLSDFRFNIVDASIYFTPQESTDSVASPQPKHEKKRGPRRQR